MGVHVRWSARRRRGRPRGYDPAKTSEAFTQDPVEATKPPFRVAIVNR